MKEKSARKDIEQKVLELDVSKQREAFKRWRGWPEISKPDENNREREEN